MLSDAADTGSPRRIWTVALFVLAVAIGTLLRWSQLSDQIVADDE